MRDRIQTLFENYVTEHKFSGVALIKEKDNIIFELATGFAHKGYQIHNGMETKFDTASITKVFTAAGIVLLESEGKLNFTDKIHDIIDLSSTEIPTDVEIRHLLTHTSGIADDADEESGEDYSELFVSFPNYAIRENKDFLKNFAYKKPNFKAGTAVRYNNCAFVLLGLVIEQISGVSYRDFITENIFKKFGMKNTMFHAMDDVGENIAEGYYFSPKEQKHKKNIYSYPPIGTGDSGAYTTAYDLDKFFRTLQSSTVFSKMLQPQTELTRSNDTGILRYGYGLEFIEINGIITSIYKEGYNAGVCNITAYYPKQDITFTILGNQDCNVWRLHDLVQKLLLDNNWE